MTPPVLFLIFNRPDLVEQSFAPIRAAKPKQLFIAADGPRLGRDEEADFCRKSRAIVDQVDWNCEVKTLFRDKNLGCREAVSSAITWFFEHVEEGIILEDDCVADSSFFPFCAELLDRYRANNRVLSIAGRNHQNSIKRGRHSYYFSDFQHIWGWATWRRAWKLYSGHEDHFRVVESSGFLRSKFGDHAEKEFLRLFRKTLSGEIDSWGYLWLLNCWATKGVAVLPNADLVSNIGFDERATHTIGDSVDQRYNTINSIAFPLAHPPKIRVNYVADVFTFRNCFGYLQEPSLFARFHAKMQRTASKCLIKLRTY